MICPNCGATLERHAFTHVCSYCGYVSAANGVQQQNVDNSDKSTCYFKYLSANLQTIKQSPFVDINKLDDAFECISTKPFYPNDGHYTLDKTLSFKWYAKVAKPNIYFELLVKSLHTDAQNYLCIKSGQQIFSFKQRGERSDMLSFPMTISDFLLFCEIDKFEIDTNLYNCAYNNNYQEFVTYTRRIYNAIIDMSKYRYSINTKLLTD